MPAFSREKGRGTETQDGDTVLRCSSETKMMTFEVVGIAFLQ